MINVVQGSPEWQALRAGKFTASKFSDLMAKLASGKPAKSRDNVIWEAAIERMTGKKMEQTFSSSWMERGIALESEARIAYQDDQMVSVKEVGFVIHPDHDYVSCSPDGLVGTEGLVEIKCLTAANHGEALLAGKHATDYKWQVQGQMWVTGCSWCDVVAYHPDFPEELKLAIVRVWRDPKMIRDLEIECVLANQAVLEVINKLKNRSAT